MNFVFRMKPHHTPAHTQSHSIVNTHPVCRNIVFSAYFTDSALLSTSYVFFSPSLLTDKCVSQKLVSRSKLNFCSQALGGGGGGGGGCWDRRGGSKASNLLRLKWKALLIRRSGIVSSAPHDAFSHSLEFAQSGPENKKHLFC